MRLACCSLASTIILIYPKHMPTKITREAALRYHEEGRPGKIAIIPTKPYATAYDLSLAYSPGVAEPCLAIADRPADAYRYTSKGNLVGIDAFDIEVDATDPEAFISAVKAISPTFGAINLEDIKAPECFEIERRLKAELPIPVMHDDQHGTAIISGAGLVNALELAGKSIGDVRIVISGAGAAAIACARLYCALGAKHEHIVMTDSKGVIRASRTDLNEMKREFATKDEGLTTLQEALVGADVFVGLSKGGMVTGEMVKTMADRPIIFALANPTPEISYEEAKAACPEVLMSTGRTDYPNQINNVLAFPYIFRGALDTHATAINGEMELAATRAIAALAKQPVPDYVCQAYGAKELAFGPEYFIPKPVDRRLIVEVSTAVARAAIESGVARHTITDWEAYAEHLTSLLG